MRKLICNAIIFVATLLALHPAYAGGSGPTEAQMLPPTLWDGKTACTGASVGMLFWDGATSIKCIPGFYGDGGGNVAIGNGNIGGDLSIMKGNLHLDGPGGLFLGSEGPLTSVDAKAILQLVLAACGPASYLTKDSNGNVICANLDLALPRCAAGDVLVSSGNGYSCSHGQVITSISTTLMGESSWNSLIYQFDPSGSLNVRDTCDSDYNHRSLLADSNFNAANIGCRNALCIAYFGPIYGGISPPITDPPVQTSIGGSCAGPTCSNGSGMSQVQIHCLYAGQ